MATQREFSVALDSEELLALHAFIKAFANAANGPMALSDSGLSSNTVQCLQRHLDHTRVMLDAAPHSDPIALSLLLDQEDADSLALWIGQLTVGQIENVVDDADTADTASLALWSLMETIRPMRLPF